MEVKAGTVQRQTETVALGHTATGLSPLSPSLCLALPSCVFLYIYPSFSLSRWPVFVACLCLLHLFSFWFASVHQSPWVGFVSGSCSVGGATFATLGFGSAWVGLTAHSAFHCYCCYCSLFKCKFRRLKICKPNTKQIQKYIMKHVQTCLCSYCCSAYSCFYRLYCIILKYDGTRWKPEGTVTYDIFSMPNVWFTYRFRNILTTLFIYSITAKNIIFKYFNINLYNIFLTSLFFIYFSYDIHSI